MAAIPGAQRTQSLVLALDLAGTSVAALEGAGAATSHKLDILGVLVIAFVASLGGGIARDMLIGQTPPRALRDWRYPSVAFAAGLTAFAFGHWVQEIPPLALITLDAGALGLFAMAGTEKSLDQGLGWLAAVLIGGVNAVGGGVMRDILLSKVPAVLTRDIYATAALFGAAVMIVGRRLGLPNAWSVGLGVVCCFALRMTAHALGWQLPTAV